MYTCNVRTLAIVAMALAASSACAASGDSAASEAGEIASLDSNPPPASVDSGGGSTDDGSTAGRASGAAGEFAGSAELEQATLDYARCMREHGIDVPDPQSVDGGGGFVAAASVSELNAEEMEAANEACQPILDEVMGSFEPPDAAEVEAMREDMLDFSRCMREHGVDMPDPQFDDDGGMVISIGDAGGTAVDAEQWQEASEACGEAGGLGVFSVGETSAVDVVAVAPGERVGG